MGAKVASRSRTSVEAPSSIDALWLAALQRICGRAAHELKGAINGVAINLEVVRSRAEKPEVQAASLSRYAEAAATQLDNVILLTEALLGVSRPAREPVELAQAVQGILALLAQAVRADGGILETEGSFETLGTTAASGSAVRLAIGGTILAATSASAHVCCSAVSAVSAGSTAQSSEATVCVESRDGVVLALDAEMVAAVAAAGIRIEVDASTVLISFPR